MALTDCNNNIIIRSTVSPYQQISILKGHNENISSLIQLKNTEYIVTGGNDRTIRLWNLKTYQCISCINVRKMSNCFPNFDIIEQEKDKLLVNCEEGYLIINLKCSIIEYIRIRKKNNNDNISKGNMIRLQKGLYGYNHFFTGDFNIINLNTHTVKQIGKNIQLKGQLLLIGTNYIVSEYNGVTIYQY